MSPITPRPLGLASVGRPLLHGVDEAIVSADAFDGRPAVVAARLDAVQLIPGVLAELGRPQLTLAVKGDALRIAVAEE